MTPWLTHLTNRVIGLKNFNNFRCADQLTILEEEEKCTILKCIIVKKRRVTLMGKKRQKIQWFPVETLQWAGDEEKEYQV